ncbi:hypothetical protein NL529_28605, partial [Klebsiella pneumoniae]|nr:hypothetical protein [Klebsiella pneumoniae]
EKEITEALVRALGMNCNGPKWFSPPALLLDREGLAVAIRANGLGATAALLEVHPDAVTTWTRLHAYVPEPEIPQDRRPGQAARARAILEA